MGREGEGKETATTRPLFSLPQRIETTQKAPAELEQTGSCHLAHTGLQLLMISVDMNIISSASWRV